MSSDAFEATLAPLFEDASWVTAGLAAARPFDSLTALHAAAVIRLQATDDDTKMRFLRGHPPLSPAALQGGVTAESRAEQQSAGIDILDVTDVAMLEELNAAHLTRHGIPFILAVRDTSLATILAAMRRRAGSSAAQEQAEALREVEVISWLRLLDRVVPAGTGGISTYVLDTVRAQPGAGLAGELWHLPAAAAPCRLACFVTNEAGRAPTMLGDGDLAIGAYELRLHVAPYLAEHGAATLDRSFMPSVMVRFAVLNPEEHFHVPVLLSNGTYTAYRGR